MREKIIISANGQDKQGIVSEISSLINFHKANIETSRMIRLGNDFAMLILIDIDTKKITGLKKDLDKISHLKINITETKEQITEYKNKLHLHINGADNEGIVYSFTNYLLDLNINIEEVNTIIKNAPMSATPLFMMDLIIGSKHEINEIELKQELIKISEKLGVETILKKY
jgi:glycine cleavage system transcriptional repressor